MGTKTKVVFFIPPSVHLLDLSGPVQAFYEADCANGQYQIEYCSFNDTTHDSTGLHFAQLASYKQINLKEGDYLFVPGFSSRMLKENSYVKQWDTFYPWLRQQYSKGVKICSVCMGAFVLAKAGLLEGRKCTTHWSTVQRLKEMFGNLNIQTDKLFVKDGNIYTSAGITSGIDLALYILEENHGPLFSHKIARELVVYSRRSGAHTQESIYLSYRNHLHKGVHALQDWLVENLDTKSTIEEMASMVNMSSRNLTRAFRMQTGISINRYITLLRIEVAGNLKNSTGISMDTIAKQCGFEDVRQLQRIWKQHYGRPLTAYSV